MKFAVNICPIFLTSNTKGTNLNNLREFVFGLPVRSDWSSLQKNKIFVIDDVFKVKGIGLVLSGVVKQGSIKLGDSVNLGPFNGHFKSVVVKSIHNNFRENIDTLEAGCSGCINIKFINSKRDNISRNEIKRGMVVIETPKCINEFEAEIVVIKHPTTIRNNYQPVIHCGTVRQTAKIDCLHNNVLRTGDKATVKFKFLFHPEFMEIGTQLVFRDGNTKGIGRVTNVQY